MGLQDSGTERYPSPKLAAVIHLYFLKKTVKIEQKLKKNTKNYVILKIKKYRKILKISSKDATFDFLKEMPVLPSQ